MAARRGTEYPTLRPWSRLTSEVQIHLCGSVFWFDKELLAFKSAKIERILQKKPQADLSHLLRDIPADHDSMELVARFCHGFEISLSTENIVRVACIADYLEMTETHCSNNLLDKALLFFEQQIVPSWSNCIKALNSAENVFEEASQLGLVGFCAESIVLKALDDPRLLGEPIKNLNSDYDSDEGEEFYKPNARRKLFDNHWKSEDLTALSLRVYGPVIHSVIQRGAPQEYVAANLIQYANAWIFSCDKTGDEVPINARNYQREIVEALEKLLPNQRGLIPCTFLCQMLQFAVAVNANGECRNGLELKIGMQLEQASVKDLLIPCQGYAHDEKYDTDCLMRILKNFCSCADPSIQALNLVAELIDEFLAEISADIDLKTRTFASVADMSVALSQGTQRSSDGIYRAVDVYLDKHKHLTESEKENLCKVLDCNRLSSDACEHASRNERLPVRVVVQVLFMTQLKLREAIPKEVQGRLLKMEEDEEEAEEVRLEMEKMGSKVGELERECLVMRREIERGGGGGGGKSRKFSVWREMKRKFGCVTSMHDCNCHVKKKKVHPRSN